MSDLTDLEICKRIAEIESVLVNQIGNNYLIKDSAPHGSLLNAANQLSVCRTIEDYKMAEQRFKEYLYNPLTDDALCFRLMIKYKISLIQHQNNTSVYCIFNHDEKYTKGTTGIMTDPKRAICLAIIESKNYK